MIQDKLATKVFDILVGTVDNSNIFDLSVCSVKTRISSTKNPFSKHPVVIMADPFLFVLENKLFLFYEEQKDLNGKGVIKMRSTKDLINWSDPVLVLEEPFHLSYPNVFECNNEFYLLPETGHNGDIRLYKSNGDLSKWHFQKTLLSGENYVDSSIILRNGLYYLFTSIYKGNKNYELKIFTSSEIDGDWMEHRQSPISYDSQLARCGGPIIEYNNELYRMAQECGCCYGGGLNAYKVNQLSPDSYQESFHQQIMPSLCKGLTKGGHHYSYTQFNGVNVFAVDYLSNSYNLYEIIRRVKLKINKLL